MKDVGGKVISVEGTNASRRVDYDGVVNHTKFENKSINIVPNAKRTSWNFVWADAMTRVLGIAENQELSDFARSVLMLNSLLAATQKSVKLQIASADLTQLKNSNYRLCFAKKVGDNAYNVVWQYYVNF